MKKIIKCGKSLDCKTIYGLKIDGEVVLTSINRARIFAVYFDFEYPVKENL